MPARHFCLALAPSFVLVACAGEHGDAPHASGTSASSTSSTGGDGTTSGSGASTGSDTGSGGFASSGEGGSGTGAAGGSGGTMGEGGSGGCGDLTYQGKCEGETLVWCEREMVKTADCAALGKTCKWVDDTIGYNCVGGFGYPVGDLTTWPAGGWTVTQVLGHYLNWGGFVGGHLAQDVAAGEAATANAPVHSIGDGVVLYAGPNSSTYVNVVLIQHDLGNGETVCSFYGHLGSVTVSEGQTVARGDPIATVLDWQAHFGAPNSHLHYVVLSADLCAASDAANGALVCGYDDTPGPNGITDLSNEPYSYTSVGDVCGDHNYPNAFISPSQFIEAHHF